MRFLFTFTGGYGHAEPLVPVAAAARAGGHAVAFLGRASVLAGLAERGFDVLSDGLPPDEPRTEITPLMAPDLEYEAGLMRSRFAGDFARRRAARVAEACGEWPPDAVVFDEPDFGSHVAAEGLGLPYACSLCLAAGGFVRPDVVAEPVDALRAAHGLAPDPQLAAGLPSVLLPIGADQPLNAARATALGVAVALDVMRATPNEVRAAVETVLGDPRYRAAAERVRDEIAALPGPEAAVAALARIGRTP